MDDNLPPNSASPTQSQAQPTNVLTGEQPLAPESPKKSKLPFVLIGLLILGLLISVAYLFYQNNQLKEELEMVMLNNAVVEAEVSITPTGMPLIDNYAVLTPTSNPIPTTIMTGANLSQIKYTLPTGWTADLNSERLYISPGTGGYYSIKMYNYPNTGRRDYYCEITNFCIDATYFDTIQLGNISGYSANALDNSGGGTEYFGAKGDKFYVISSYSPSASNDFDLYRQVVLDSLEF